MQVLVLAVQNAVDYTLLGVATSGVTLFRSIGGSIGVSLFGAIFANQLATNLASRVPPGAAVPDATDPATIAALPDAVHAAYVEAFATSIRPVFLAAAFIAAVAFVLTWFLRSGPAPHGRGGGNRRELRVAALGRLVRGDRALAVGAVATREPLGRLCRSRRAGRGGGQPGGRVAARPARRRDRPTVEPERLPGRCSSCAGTDFVAAAGSTETGRAAHDRLVAARGKRIAELLDGWEPEQHAELEEVVAGFARDLAAEMPREPS